MSSAPQPPLIPSPTVMEGVVRHWAVQWVQKLGLCPWAGQVLIKDRMRIITIDHDPEQATGLRAIEQLVLDECKLLIPTEDAPPPVGKPQTTLIILPQLIQFEDYLDLHAHLEGLLEDKQLSEHIQLASFHPLYQFAATLPEDVENYTNRSPYPLLHLLRVDQVADAVEQVGNTDKIWQRNISLMKSLGLTKVRGMQQQIHNHGLSTAIAAQPQTDNKQ